MNTFLRLTLLLFFSLAEITGLHAQASRQKTNLNRAWKFFLGDPAGAQEAGYDDRNWQTVGLPHSFSIPYFMSPDFYMGYGFYRKTFEIPQNYAGRKVAIEFEGAFQDAQIFVNGKQVGTHQGGYTGFSIDVTTAVKPGSNLLAVRLNNLWNPRLAPRAGEHVFSGGIYRDVNLTVTDPVHVTWYGTSVTTPIASERSARVNVRTEVANEETRPVRVRLQTDLIGPGGELFHTLSTVKTLKPGEVYTFVQQSPALKGAQLWSPEHPNLYRAVNQISVHGKLRDRYVQPFGIRSIRWSADSGFFLNGRHLYLRGVNVHQDHAGWGDAVTNRGFYRDVKMVKDAGFNFIRGSHYPRDPAFTEACDRLGILFWSENAFWGIGGFNKTPEGYWNSSAYPTRAEDRSDFDASVLRQLQEMIRIFRNSPSIIAWSMSNEPFFTSSSAMGPMRELLKKSVNLSHRLDPSRPAAIGGAQRPLDSTRIDLIGDIAGYNGDGASVAVFQKPGVASVVSEYGSTTAERPGKFEPGWGDLSKDNGRETYSWRGGQAIWCAFDHGSIAGSALGKMGIIDYFRIPKRAWYWYRNAYARIAPPKWPAPGKAYQLSLSSDRIKGIGTDGTDDVQLKITVLDETGAPLSNTPPVKLEVVSGPGEFPTGPAIDFEKDSDIRILDGQAAISFRSYYAGATVIRASSPGLLPSEIRLSFTGGPQYVKGISPQRGVSIYQRFIKKNKAVAETQFGRDNPTFASTSHQAHSAGFAADGNVRSWWQPSPDDQSPYWILDMEKKAMVSLIKLTFPRPISQPCKVEISDDRLTWQSLGNLSPEQNPAAMQTVKPERPVMGRFIRISFTTASDAALSEIEVSARVIE